MRTWKQILSPSRADVQPPYLQPPPDYPQPRAPCPPARLRRWSGLVQGVIAFLVGNSAPRITHKTIGQTQGWIVYDPIDASYQQFTQEHEVRIWLEQRYYR